ncbi:MAG: hypothetical protein VW339_15100, partial [Quisquiliibacterium sp.]
MYSPDTGLTLPYPEVSVPPKPNRFPRAFQSVLSAVLMALPAVPYWLARMLSAGEDVRFIARRMVIFASEDVGMADPQALTVAVSAATAVDVVGMPEAQLNLAEAAIYLASAPKGNSVARAIWSAMADIKD